MNVRLSKPRANFSAIFSASLAIILLTDRCLPRVLFRESRQASLNRFLLLEFLHRGVSLRVRPGQVGCDHLGGRAQKRGRHWQHGGRTCIRCGLMPFSQAALFGRPIKWTKLFPAEKICCLGVLVFSSIEVRCWSTPGHHQDRGRRSRRRSSSLMGEALVVGEYGRFGAAARQTIGYVQRAPAAVITMLHPGRRASNSGSAASLKKSWVVSATSFCGTGECTLEGCNSGITASV